MFQKSYKIIRRFFGRAGLTGRKAPAGMTLVEAVIALAVSSMIFLLVTGVYQLSQNIYLTTDTKAELSQNGRVILDRMVREIRQSQYIVTTMPLVADDTAPDEIMFQNGHDLSQITYIRYYLNGEQQINRQVIAYYFAAAPSVYVDINATEKDTHNPPTATILEDKLIGEYVDDIEFSGDRLISINLYLSKNEATEIISTAVFGRNL